METSQAKAIVNDRIRWLRWALGLQDWSIKVFYERLQPAAHTEDGFRATGQCTLQPEYRQATIYLDADVFDDEEELLEVLLHEFLHIIISPFKVFQEFATLGDDPERTTANDVAYRHAMELTINNLERMLRTQLGLDVDGLCNRAAEHAGKSTRHCPETRNRQPIETQELHDEH